MLFKAAIRLVVAALVFGVLTAVPAAADEPAGALLTSAAAGNVDGLAGDEIFTVHSVEADPGSIDYTVELALRRGRDGSLLWSREFPVGSISVVPARVGSDGVRGMYVLVRRFNYFIDISTEADGVSILTPLPLLYGGNETGYDVYAVTAAGDVLWEDHITYTPDQTNPGRSLNAPRGLVVANATPSGADDLALMLADAPTVVTETNQGEATLRVVVLEGADGSEAANTSLGQVDFGLAGIGVADLDGDTLDDFAINMSGGDVIAVRGRDGTSLWRSEGAFTTNRVIADITRDGIADLLASDTFTGTSLPGLARVIDGRSGATLYEVDAHAVWPTADGIAAALEVSTAEEIGFELDYYDGGGVNRRHRDVVVPRNGRPSASADLWTSLGDLNGDGGEDVYYTITFNSGSPDETSTTEIIDGSTFAPLWGNAPIGRPLHAGRTGAGDDLLLIEPFGAYAVEVGLQDGATGATQWVQRLVPDADETGFTQTSGGDFDGDGALDVLVTLDTSTRAEPGTIPDDLGQQTNSATFMYVLDGGSGATLWNR